MSDQWYYQAFGQEFGPLAEEEVARMLLTGELTADDEVREGTEGTWKRAGAVSGLMELVTAVAVQTAEVATDIDSFMLVDEQEVAPAPPDDTPAIDDFDLAPEVTTIREKFPEPEVEEVVPDEPAVWYFQTFGNELGPVPLSELAKLVDRGELSASDAIRMGTEGDWITAGEIPELFPMGRGTPRPPTSRHPASAPPATHSTWQAPVHRPVPETAPEWDAPRTQPLVSAAQAWTAPDAAVDVNWYCYLNEQEVGPVAITDLQAMAAAGQVTAEVYVKYGAQGEWLLASQVPNLLPSVEAAPATPSQVVFVPVAPAAAPTLSLADAERSELVQQLLALLKKEGLQTSLLGSIAAPTTGAGWYCNISGSVMGPVSIEALVQMVLQKRIFPDDLIRLGDSGEWFPAKTVPDLFPDTTPGKGKKGGLDDDQSVMARIDQMYREAQEAKAKAEAEEAKNPSAKSKNEPSRSKLAGNMLAEINAKMARGKTEAELAAERAARMEEFYGGLKLDRRAIIVLSILAALGGGYLLMPYMLSGIIAGQGYESLLKIQASVVKEKEKGVDAAAWEKKSKDIIKSIDAVAKSVRGGATGSAKRDVARMANYLKEMVRSMAKKSQVAAGSDDEYTRALKHFEEYKKGAKKKLGK